MIKLIATDIDGTLLNSKKQVPPGFKEAVDRFYEAGIKFIAASGRQYFNLLDLFPGQEHKVTFISENGSLVFEDGINIFHSKIKPEHIKEPLIAARGIKNAFPVFCGIQNAYVENDDPFLLENVDMYYKNVKSVSDLSRISGDIICKIAVFDKICGEDNSYPALKRFEKYMQVAVSGIHWVDLTEPGINKGSAIRLLQERYGIKPEECMAFGDYLNDLEMMRSCGYSYAVANAHGKIKEICKYQTKSNDENGVMEVLDTVLNMV